MHQPARINSKDLSTQSIASTTNKKSFSISSQNFFAKKGSCWKLSST